jgi:hypothetical protein
MCPPVAGDTSQGLTVERLSGVGLFWELARRILVKTMGANP